jgi:hypothetical protein
MELNLYSLQEFGSYMWKGFEQSIDRNKLLVSYQIKLVLPAGFGWRYLSLHASRACATTVTSDSPRSFLEVDTTPSSLGNYTKPPSLHRNVNVGLRVTAHIANVPPCPKYLKVMMNHSSNQYSIIYITRLLYRGVCELWLGKWMTIRRQNNAE